MVSSDEKPMRELEHLADALAEAGLEPPLSSERSAPASKKAVVPKHTSGEPQAPAVTPSFVQKTVEALLLDVSQRMWDVACAHHTSSLHLHVACVEMSLLCAIKTSLEQPVPSNRVFYEPLFEHAVVCQKTLHDLRKQGLPRVRRLVEHCRSLSLQASVWGVDATPYKRALADILQSCDTQPALENDETSLYEPLCAVYAQLQHTLMALQPGSTASLLQRMTVFS